MYIHTHIHIHTYIFLFLAKAGRISPTGSLTYNRYDSDNSYGWGRVPEPTYMSNPHWWRYRDKNCCHPKNTCHFCFYRDIEKQIHTNGTTAKRQDFYDVCCLFGCGV